MIFTYPKNSFESLQKNTFAFCYQKLAKPASAFFVKVFEFKNIKQVIGLATIALALIVSLGPSLTGNLQFFFYPSLSSVRSEGIELTTKQSLQKPVENFRLTKGYSFFHAATDFATDAGTVILSILPGKVEKVVRGRFGYGNYIVINHGSGLKSLYAHLIKINVRENQAVDEETIIGLVGSTGWSTGPHLHLEIIEDKKKVNPRAFFEAYLGKKLASTR